MRRFAFRTLLAHKRRFALTTLSIALGVTLIASTFVFTDTINGSFRTIFSTTYRNIDVAVTRADDADDPQQRPQPLPPALLERVRAVAGVETAAGAIFTAGLIARHSDGKEFGGVGFSAAANILPQPFDQTEYVAGRAPRTDSEVTIPKATADNESLKVGDRLRLSVLKPRKTYTISGIGQIADAPAIGGGLLVGFTTVEAQRISDIDGYNEIYAAAADGISATELRDRVRAALADERGIVVRTGDEQAGQAAEQLNDLLGVLRNSLLAFAGIALLVGAFLIFNTFSIIVAQRSREIGLLRVLGAGRGQIMRSVLTEGFVLGVVGSLVGFGLGVLTAFGIRELFAALGSPLPDTGMVIAARTVIVSLIVGVTTTLIACLIPAIKAMRVAPLTALREGLEHVSGPSRRITILASLTVIAGVLFLLFGIFGSGSTRTHLSTIATGAVLLFIGIALLSPWLVRPIAQIVGLPLRAVGSITGRLAQENTTRNPGRTAVTSAALMIGVTLVTFASVFAAALNNAIRDTVESGFRGQAILDVGNGIQAIPTEALQTTADTPGVAVATGLRSGVGRSESGSQLMITGIDPATFSSLYQIKWVQGDRATLTGMQDDQTILTETYAENNKLAVGDTVTVSGQGDVQRRLKVIGIIEDDAGVFDSLAVTGTAAAASFGAPQLSFIMARFSVPESQNASVLKAIDERIQRKFQGIKVQSNVEFIQQQEDQVGQLLTLIYGLLAMAIIISLFGIANTLILSISERIREIGLLRAIGMSRRQVRRMVTFESIITSCIGAAIGLIVGLLLAILVMSAVPTFSVTVPVVTLIVLFICAIGAGVLAAITPAISASRIDTLEALAYE